MTRKVAKSRPGRHPPPCPQCASSSIVPIIHGLPSPAAAKAIERGEAIRADREEWEGMPEWHCKECGCDWSGRWRRFKKPART